MDFTGFNAGAKRQRDRYQSFEPSLINQEWTWTDAKINTLLAEANHKLGELNAFSLYVPDIDYFIAMHVAKEATTSSRIEGTRTEIEEAMLIETDVLPEKRDDWNEVQNYIRAMNHAIGKLRTLPVSTRMLKETHKMLMSGVRGAGKTPGEFRTTQNWIGGATLRDAVFIPPHHHDVNRLMGDLESFLHNTQIDVPLLIRAALAHYQFETIHPFADGNGRIGRLLITLYLVSEGLLKRPTLYLSEYFEKHKNLYYDNLMRVRTANDVTQWVKFFLVAVAETSKKGIETLSRILALKEAIEGKRIVKLGRKMPRAKELLDVLFRTPVVSVAQVEKALGVAKPTANSLVDDFVRLKILEETTGAQRNRIFAFREYIHLFNV
jgi:Fic family protein